MKDSRDWFIMILVGGIWAAGTVFIFRFGSKENAVALMTAWGGICATMGGIYHWLTIRDDKQKDERE